MKTKKKEESQNVSEVVEDERYYVLNVAGDFNITVNEGGKVNILYGKPQPPPPPPHHP